MKNKNKETLQKCFFPSFSSTFILSTYTQSAKLVKWTSFDYKQQHFKFPAMSTLLCHHQITIRVCLGYITLRKTNYLVISVFFYTYFWHGPQQPPEKTIQSSVTWSVTWVRSQVSRYQGDPIDPDSQTGWCHAWLTPDRLHRMSLCNSSSIQLSISRTS